MFGGTFSLHAAHTMMGHIAITDMQAKKNGNRGSALEWSTWKVHWNGQQRKRLGMVNMESVLEWSTGETSWYSQQSTLEWSTGEAPWNGQQRKRLGMVNRGSALEWSTEEAP